jgi:hypothetical protein
MSFRSSLVGHGIAQDFGALANSQLALEIEDSDVSDAPLGDVYGTSGGSALEWSR